MTALLPTSFALLPSQALSILISTRSASSSRQPTQLPPSRAVMITLSRAGSMRSSASTGLPAPQRPTTMLTSSLAELIPATRASLSKMQRGASPRAASLQLMLLRVLQARQAIRMRVCSTLTSLSPMLIRTPFTS